MELRHLRSFLAVAEELNFGRAATRLNISQPPLSQQIKRLENELGVVLLARTKRRVELTDAGMAFLREARITLDQAERCADAARRASRGEIGTLSLGFVPAADLRVLPAILPIFKSRFPDVNLMVSSLTNVDQLEALRAGRLNVGLLYEPVDLRLGGDRNFKVETLLRERFVAVLPVTHRLSRRKSIALSDLSAERFVVYRRDVAPAYHDWVLSIFRQAGFSPTVVQESDHIQTSVGLVASGLGVAILPQSVTKIRRDEVTFVTLRPPVPTVDMALMYPHHQASLALQAFLDVARECAKQGFRRSIARKS